MTPFSLYQNVCEKTSKLITEKYSTSFSRSVKLLDPEIRTHIYNVYGFVRLADEIVDTFHDFNKKELLDRFIKDYKDSLVEGISINPVIQSFCETQKKFNIPQHLVDAFLQSMEMDLGDMESLNKEEYDTYIYGSAEVVGLICIMIFLNGNQQEYEALKPTARSFGAALQKVNFLRDIHADYHQLNRTYFPNVDFKNFTDKDKSLIEDDIAQDFKMALEGIKKLPSSSRYAVYLAYRYYNGLFKKIQATKSSTIFKKRIRLNNFEKMVLYFKILVYKNLNINSNLS